MDVSTAFKQRSLMENNMKHALKNSIEDNMHGLLESSLSIMRTNCGQITLVE